MVREKEPIFEAKPGIYGFKVNLIALWNHMFSKREPDPVLVVPNRILQVFKDHDVAISQIPRLIPQLSLGQLSSAEVLLPAITPEIIQKVADLFQVQRKWLEGTTDIIYDCRYYCYKNPWRFFEDLKTLKMDDLFGEPIIAFTSVSKLDNTSAKDQPVLLVQREECTELDGKTIYRYRIVDQFFWGYFKTRIQLKAMMRSWYKRFEIPVNIYQVEKKVLKDMASGKVVPHLYLRSSNKLWNISLEDFSLMLEENRVSKEGEELPEVFEYIKLYKLERMDGKNPKNSQETAKYR